MIEVERKFIISNGVEKKILQSCVFLGEKKFTDIYYDDDKYSLTGKDNWLRSRDNNFEYKISLKNRNERGNLDQYDEIQDINKIYECLNINNTGDFKLDLNSSGILPFCSITTTRKKYKNDCLSIDIDSMGFGYSIMEIEMMVENETEINSAKKTIENFINLIGVSSERPRGKVLEYLKRHIPEHFKALVKAGVEKE